MNVLWGKLASEILMQDWDAALDDLNRLREVLDSNVSSSVHQYHNFFLLIDIPSHYEYIWILGNLLL